MLTLKEKKIAALYSHSYCQSLCPSKMQIFFFLCCHNLHRRYNVDRIITVQDEESVSFLVNILRGHIFFLLILSNICSFITFAAGCSQRIFRTLPPVNRPIHLQVCILEKSKYIKLEGGCYHALAAPCTSHLVYTKDVLGEDSHLD